MNALEWVGVLVLLFVLLAPAIYLVGGLGSLGRDVMTEQKIRNLFLFNKPGVACDQFERMLGTLDPEVLHQMMLLSLRNVTGKELGDFAVAYWKRLRKPRLYDVN